MAVEKKKTAEKWLCELVQGKQRSSGCGVNHNALDGQGCFWLVGQEKICATDIGAQSCGKHFKFRLCLPVIIASRGA